MTKAPPLILVEVAERVKTHKLHASAMNHIDNGPSAPPAAASRTAKGLPPPFNQKRLMIRNILGLFSIIASGIILGMVCYLYTEWDEWEYSRYYDPEMYWISPIASVSIAAGITEFLVMCAGRLEGMPPGLRVAIHLLLFIGWAFCFGFECRLYDIVSYSGALSYCDESWNQTLCAHFKLGIFALALMLG